jgi:hypothetical protein
MVKWELLARAGVMAMENSTVVFPRYRVCALCVVARATEVALLFVVL